MCTNNNYVIVTVRSTCDQPSWTVWLLTMIVFQLLLHEALCGSKLGLKIPFFLFKSVLNNNNLFVFPTEMICYKALRLLLLSFLPLTLTGCTTTRSSLAASRTLSLLSRKMLQNHCIWMKTSR
jgi:hypothetical protein